MVKLHRFLLKRSRRVVAGALIAGVISGAANTVALAIINEAINRRPETRFPLLPAFFVSCFILATARVASELLLARLAQDALLDLRRQLSRRILAAPLRRLEEIGVPRLLAALTDDVPAITNVVNIIPVICINLAIVIACLIYMGLLSWLMLAVVMGLVAIGVIGYQITVAKALRHLRQAREEGDILYKNFRALTEGVKELKLHRKRRENFLTQVLEKSAVFIRNSGLEGLKFYTLAASWGQLLVFVTIGLWVFALPWMTGVGTVTLTGFTLAILYMMSPLQVIMNTLPAFGRGEVALSNIDQLGLSLTECEEPEPAVSLSPQSQAEIVRLSQVTHTYYCEGEDRNFSLGPIDLVLNPGELIFLAGGNGSGKTTLAKLLVGLYAPETGEIQLGGKKIDDATREYYRQHFSVVFSDYYLFDSLLGMESSAVDMEAGSYLSRLQLSQKVQIKDGTFSTTDLSQGQRKRLALLTAYLENRPIYVFDEWAADQDPFFKEIFYLQLLPELKVRGKTVVVISHDDRYYCIGDRIIKLEYGKIVSEKEDENLGVASSVAD